VVRRDDDVGARRLRRAFEERIAHAPRRRLGTFAAPLPHDAAFADDRNFETSGQRLDELGVAPRIRPQAVVQVG